MRDDPVRGTYGRALIVIALLLAAVCGCSSAKTAPLGARTDGFDSFAVEWCPQRRGGPFCSR